MMFLIKVSLMLVKRRSQFLKKLHQIRYSSIALLQEAQIISSLTTRLICVLGRFSIKCNVCTACVFVLFSNDTFFVKL